MLEKLVLVRKFCTTSDQIHVILDKNVAEILRRDKKILLQTGKTTHITERFS